MLLSDEDISRKVMDWFESLKVFHLDAMLGLVDNMLWHC